MIGRRALLAAGLALVAAPVLAQTAPAPEPSPAPTPAAAPTPAPRPLPRVAIVTSVGRIVAEIDNVRAPITGNNFLHYVDRKWLDGVKFYRVVKPADHFGFVQFGTLNDPKKTLPPVKHEPTTLTGIRHVDFTLSTARLQPGSARGDFTIVVGDQPSFDADPKREGDNLGYAAFGHVVEGQEVVLKIFDAPDSPTATMHGSFKGEVPVSPVTIISVRRVPAGS